ncbi:hypothetical protein B0H10DRAFT_447467 [Mycena sp. CBHHK59/15]|nr:hypothetical protein B0H10DRAFT_447467 [Mycena sp. CBHHK59/15]
MLRRVALAFKREHSALNKPHFVSVSPSPCHSNPSLYSLTYIRSMAILAASHVARSDGKNSNRIPCTVRAKLPQSSPDPATTPPQPKKVLFELFQTKLRNPAILEQVHASPILLQYLLDPEQVRDLLHDLASSKNPYSAYRALNFARKLGCQLKQNAYEAIAYRLAAAKQWDLILTMVSSGKTSTGKTTSRLLNWRALALLESRHFADLDRIVDEFEENGFKPSRRTFHLVISGHIRNHDLARAKEWLQKMELAGFQQDASTHALVGTLYQHIGPDEQVKERALASIPHISSSSATAMMNSLMRLRLRIHDLDEVLYLLSAFDQSKVGSLSSMMAASRTQRGDTPKNATERVRILSDPVAPDATTFAMFIDYYEGHPDLPRALAVVEHMSVAGIDPTTRTVTSLIRACFSAGHGGMAVRLVASICDAQTTLPEMFENLPSPTEYHLPFDTSGIQPTPQIFNTLLRGVLRTHGLPSAHSVFRLMGANHLKPDSTTSEIITSHVHRVERGEAGTLIWLVRRLSRRSARPTLRHAHIVLSSIMRYERFLLSGMGWDNNAVIFSRTRVANHKPYPEGRISTRAASFDPMAGIELPERLAYRRLFDPVEKGLREQSTKSDRATIALRIRHDAVIKGDMDSATEVFQTMIARGMHPNAYHFSALMEGFTKAGDFESAVDVMRSASRASVEPNVLMFTILIVGYARRGDPGMALRIFRQMVAASIKPDVPAIDAVAGAFFAVGAYQMCWRVLTSLWQYISPLPPNLENASLEAAARYFRTLHRGQQQGLKKITNEQRLALMTDLRYLFREWVHWRHIRWTRHRKSRIGVRKN